MIYAVWHVLFHGHQIQGHWLYHHQRHQLTQLADQPRNSGVGRAREHCGINKKSQSRLRKLLSPRVGEEHVTDF